MSSPSALSTALLDLAWQQWATIGGSASGARASSRAVIDLEALALLTFEVGRDDPRLFDVALDWLYANAPLLSTARLKALCRDETDGRLAAAAVEWLAAHGRGARRQRTSTTPTLDHLEALFADTVHGHALDPTYARHGLARPPAQPAGKAQPPDLLSGACLGLRLRAIFGVGARAEIIRAVLTIDAPRVEFGVIHASAGFTSRALRDAIEDLVHGGVLQETRLGRTSSYTIDRDAWWLVIDHDASARPGDYPWRQLFDAGRTVVRWERSIAPGLASDYLRASSARDLWETIEPDLRFAGVRMPAAEFAPGTAFLHTHDLNVMALGRHINLLAGTSA